MATKRSGIVPAVKLTKVQLKKMLKDTFASVDAAQVALAKARSLLSKVRRAAEGFPGPPPYINRAQRIRRNS